MEAKISLAETIKETQNLGLDFIVCTSSFYEHVKKEFPELTREKDGKCYIWKYRCEFVDELKAYEGKIALSNSYGTTRRIGHAHKPSKQEFLDAKCKHKNFAKDYLMKSKKY